MHRFLQISLYLVFILESIMKSSPESKEILEFTEEVERAIERTKRHKAHEMDGGDKLSSPP